MVLVHISAKIPQSNKVFEAFEDFKVISSNIVAKEIENESSFNEIEDYIPPKINNSYDYKKQYNEEKTYVTDIVVDIENKPLKGAHINAYVKNDFIPNDNRNVKVGSTITNDNGEWRLELSKGEYVIEFKAIGMKVVREFRKV